MADEKNETAEVEKATPKRRGRPPRAKKVEETEVVETIEEVINEVSEEEFGGVEEIEELIREAEEEDARIIAEELAEEELLAATPLEEKEAAVKELSGEQEELLRRYDENQEKIDTLNINRWATAVPNNAPGYWHAFSGPGGNINVFTWLSVLFLFIFPPLSFLFSGLGIVNSRNMPTDKVGKIVGWFVMVLSIIGLIAVVISALVAIGAMAAGDFNRGIEFSPYYY